LGRATTTDWDTGAEAGEIPLLTWGLLRQVFTAETLMTPRCDLFTGEQGADLALGVVPVS